MKSLAIALCAPSGTGKTTVARGLVAKRDDLVFSVSATTRPPRPGERSGVDYHFISRDEFQSMIDDGELLEWAEVHGELYGTPRANLDAAEQSRRKLLMDIDVQGARQVAQARPDTVTVFLLPPSTEAWLERLRQRGSESDEQLQRRLETAKGELLALEEFDYAVVNERLEDAISAVEAIIEGKRQRSSHAEMEALRRKILEDLSATWP